MNTVSIIMPTYNCSFFVCQAIESVIAQTFTDWELIIVDDCSTDNTWELIQAQNDSRISIYKTHQNSGAGTARNIAIQKAKGRFIAFIDGDDWWYPEKLEKQLAFMQKEGFAFSCTWYEDAYADLTPYHISRPHDKQSFRYMLHGNEVGTPGVIYDTQKIGKVYMPDLRTGEDWGLWMRILKKVDFLHVCPIVLFKYRHNEQSVTQDKWKMTKAVINVYKQELNYSTIRAWITFVFRFLPRNIMRKLDKTFHKC